MQDKVLIVEDSKTAANIVGLEIKRSCGFSVVIASSYEQAEVELARNQGDFFVAVVDLHLPDAEKGEAISLVVEAGIPAIAYTALVDEELRQDMFLRGTADYVQKQGRPSINYLCYLVKRIAKNRKTKLLIAHGCADVRFKLSQILQRQSYQVTCASTGKEALACLQSGGIAMVLIGTELEDTSGVELTAHVRAHHLQEELSIIGITGSDRPGWSVQFIKNGANDFLHEDCATEELLCCVNQNIDTIEQFGDLKKADEQRKIFMAMAAHDIRSPLALINTICRLLPQRESLSEVALKRIHDMEVSSENLLQLLEELLIYASSEGELQLQKTPVLLSALLQERVALLQSSATAKQISIKLYCGREFAVEIDQRRMEQVIDNFLSNAIKYSPPETTIAVKLSLDKNFIRTDFVDQGPGIEEAERQKLFGTFSMISTQPTAGENSIGLGLAICKKMIEAHDGDVGYQPGIGIGSNFFFRLPISVS